MPFAEDEFNELLPEEDPARDWLENPNVPTSNYIQELINSGFEIRTVYVGGQYGVPRYTAWKLTIEDEETRRFILDCGLRSEIRTENADETHQSNEDEKDEYILIHREIAVKMLKQERSRRQ